MMSHAFELIGLAGFFYFVGSDFLVSKNVIRIRTL